MPDELKKHSLSDGVGGQYSTNLDRNRYGADDQYLSTVIRYDLEYLRLCPCLVDVEIIDAKNGTGTILVSAGEEFCACSDAARKVPPPAATLLHSCRFCMRALFRLQPLGMHADAHAAALSTVPDT